MQSIMVTIRGEYCFTAISRTPVIMVGDCDGLFALHIKKRETIKFYVAFQYVKNCLNTPPAIV
jgi:hypothetical protein